MSYKTYTTEALVCGSAAHNTSDKNYLLFSREGGMIWATARSVREERSKQRQALQDFSWVRVSLVKGKSGWRIGSAEALGNSFLSAQTRSERGIVKQVILQLRRYVHGEVSLPRVYDDVAELLLCNTADERDLSAQLFSVRLLSELGYVAPDHAWMSVVEAQSLRDAVALYTEHMQPYISRAIHEGAQASHL